MNAVVAIVGRANVGKSTLFNRLVGERRAIVFDRPGVTRDRIVGRMKTDKRQAWVVDTGGLIPEAETTELTESVKAQIFSAMKEAALILVVFDGREGMVPLDQEMTEWARKSGKPVIAIVNKMDPRSTKGSPAELYKLGISPLFEVSAEHGSGLDELREEIWKRLPLDETVPAPLPAGNEITVAFLGRPNVGKSSIINAILREPRLVVSEIPGTTRDTVDVAISRGDEKYVLVDTAGLRKRFKVVDRLEQFTVIKSLQSIERSDVIVLVVDASDELTTQDEKIAAAVIEKGAGLVLAVNKWDLRTDSPKERQDFRDDLYAWAPFLSFAVIRYVSAKTGKAVDGILAEAKHVVSNLRRRFKPEVLRRAFEKISTAHPPSGSAGIRLKLFGMEQTSEEIPTFFVWCNDPRWVNTAYQRYWTNAVRKALKLDGVPSRVVFRRKALAAKQRNSWSKSRNAPRKDVQSKRGKARAR